MSRRLLLPLLSALALLLASAPAALAAPAANAGPAASAATADDDTACSDDPEVDLPPCEEATEDDGGGGDAAELCDDSLGDDSSGDDGEDWSDDEEPFGEACDQVAPTISDLAASVSGRGRRARIRVTFSLDLPGAVELTLERSDAGVTRGGRCAAAPARSAAKGKGEAKGSRSGKRAGRSCTRLVTLRGTVTVDGDEGANAVQLRRRWSGRALAAGSYRLTATPADDGGEPVSTTFTLAAAR